MNNRVLLGSTQSANDTVYLHTDHLGSVEATTNALGQFVNRMSFGAWGERQKADWKPGSPTETFLTTNGFTGHDQLDSHNLVHMGGRVYDPNLGRFLSADLVVQSPYNSQSYNRYSYTFNNPGSFVDPSGYGCTTHYFHNYYHNGSGSSSYMGMSTQQTCDGNDFYNQPEYNNGYENFQLPQFTLNDYLDYASQQQAVTGTLEPIDGNSFAGTACGVLGVCLRDSVQEDADVAAAERVIGAPTIFVGAMVAPGPGGKVRAAAKTADALKTSEKVSTLRPGPYAKESIPAHRGKPTAEEQRNINDLMEKYGCHTCGTKNPGTKSGNAIADHQPAQALGDPLIFLPHCNHCKAVQGGQVLQELRRNQ